MRIGKHGTREVACARYVELTKFACGQTKVEVDFANPGKMRQHTAAFLKQLKKETAEKYLAYGNSLVWATIGAGETLYMPAGWMFAEKAKDQVVGLRLPVVAVSQASSDVVQTVLASYEQAGKSDATVPF